MKTIITLALSTLLIFSGLSVANPNHKNKGDRNPLMRALHQLDLTPQQRQQIKKIRKSTKPARRNLLNQLAEGKTNMIRLVDTDKQDKAAIEAAATEQSKLMKQMILHKAELFSQIRTVLTDEQRVKLGKMRDKRERIRGIMLEDI